ncbi:MAG: TolB family protein, partial [Tannerellaceae bacterium]
DIVILDIKNNKLITSEKLSSDSVFETFPSFSPDGKKLYFCAAKAATMPDSILDIKYGLYAIDIDLQRGYISNQIDTLYNPSIEGKSVSFPRVSPDGKFLMYTLSKYGNFSIWHRDANLKMIDLATNQDIDISILNSNEAESYHTWSSNGRWVVYSSRQIDGLYTRPYLAHIDSNGIASKPFILPQEKGQFYDIFNKSYNIPEFITGKINKIDHKIRQIAQSKDY